MTSMDHAPRGVSEGYTQREQQAARALDIAWAAGLFEGEGSMTIPSETRRASLVMKVAMTDADVVERFHLVVGLGNLFWEERPPHKPLRIWVASGAEAVLVIGRLLPLLGKRRAARATECIAWFRERFVKSCPGCGLTFVAKMSFARCCSHRCRKRVQKNSPLCPRETPLFASEVRGVSEQSGYASLEPELARVLGGDR